MERAMWTDERLDDLARRMDGGFERVDSDIRELRSEVHDQGAGLRGEVQQQGSELRGEIAALRVTMMRVGGAVIAGLVGVIAAVLAGG
jgi:hypothetical protein